MLIKVNKDNVSNPVKISLIDFNISKKNQRKKDQNERKETLKKKGWSFSMDIANEELGFNCKFLTHIGSPMF